MSKEFVKHICEDYSRAEDCRISTSEGTGLGMAVVKGFTDLMNGSIDIKSEEGKGTEIAVELSFAAPTDEEKNLVTEQFESDANDHLDLNGKKVLLVEDNELNAEIAMELLQMTGMEIDWAENGNIAVEKFEKSAINTYFAVFMDMQMPVMNGLEATKQIRSLDRSDNDILIFAMTANTFTEDRKKCEDAGMNGYISKPIDLKDIENMLMKFKI